MLEIRIQGGKMDYMIPFEANGTSKWLHVINYEENQAI